MNVYKLKRNYVVVVEINNDGFSLQIRDVQGGAAG